jgi:hypothetical protein
MFESTDGFQPFVWAVEFDDFRGWVPNLPVKTMPLAIPYTQYMECGRLQLWVEESYRWKLSRNRNRPGRALLSSIMLQDPSILKNVSICNHVVKKL